jgi:hypothetical protein
LIDIILNIRYSCIWRVEKEGKAMRGRLPIMLMALVALALALSLAAALAPGAIAQDSGAAPDGAAKWMRYKMPAAQEWGTVAHANFVTQPKNCCITIQHGCQPPITTAVPTSGTNPEPVSATGTCPARPRWFCVGID